MLTTLTVCLVLAPGQGPVRNALRELKPSPPPVTKTLAKATDMLGELETSVKMGIPEALIAKAEGIVMIPDTVKAGFVMAGRGGHGVALTKTEQGTWGEPIFLHLGGVSFGAQLGYQATDLCLVFKSKKHLDRLMAGKDKMTLGVDAGVAAGPLGRRAEAATDGQFKAEVLSYSKSRGLFAGVSLDGGVLLFAEEQNKEYAKQATAKETVDAMAKLRTKLAEMAGQTK
jgi:lipid-binding SYLF domain-containing protein